MNWKFWQSADGDSERGSLIARVAGGLIAVYLILVLALAWWWDYEPELFDVRAHAEEHAGDANRQVVTGYITTWTFHHGHFTTDISSHRLFTTETFHHKDF